MKMPAEALAEVDAMLAVNPSLINALILKVQSHLEQLEPEPAGAAQEQLEWALSGADPDYRPRARASELAGRIANLASR